MSGSDKTMPGRKQESLTDWHAVRKHATSGEASAYDPGADLCDPNDEQAVGALFKSATWPRRRGPQKAPTKEQVAIRLEPEVLAAFRASGPRWQTRLNAALVDWLATHSPNDLKI